MNEMQRSLDWTRWLALSLLLSGCASQPTAPPPVKCPEPVIPQVEIPPEGYFLEELRRWILDVSDDWQSGPTG